MKDVSIYQPLVRPEMDLRRANALDILASRRVPVTEIDERPGPTGKKLHYIKHTYATRLMQDGFQNLWSFECLDYEVFKDTIMVKGKVPDPNDPKKKIDGKLPREQRSIAAKCKLTISYPMTNGNFYEQRFTEIGAFEPNSGMSTANGVASAVSRALLKCLMRGLGIGLELYEGESQAQPTPTQAWNILKRYLETRGLEWNDELKDDLQERLKKSGIKTKEDIVEKFTLAYEVANTFLEEDEKVPME